MVAGRTTPFNITCRSKFATYAFRFSTYIIAVHNNNFNVYPVFKHNTSHSTGTNLRLAPTGPLSKKIFVSSLEDPDNVDIRRAKVGLPPLQAYIDKYDLK